MKHNPILEERVESYKRLYQQVNSALEQAQARVTALRNAIGNMKRTTIGPSRSVPKDTEIWFMFADDRLAALAEGDPDKVTPKKEATRRGV